MTDVKEVINALEMSYKYSNVDEDNTLVPQQIVLYTINLLKAQETTLEKDGHHIRCLNCGEYWCDNDREGNPFPINFCPNCGRKVKWNDCSGEGYRET